jgi:hypothetical protein
MPIRNRSDYPTLRAEEQVGTEFLQLVRFGLRRADDPLIRASVRIIDALLKTSLAVALDAPALVHWGYDGWRSTQDAQTTDTGLGFHVATLQTGAFPLGTRVDFTWRREDTGEWHGNDEAVEIIAPPDLDELRSSTPIEGQTLPENSKSLRPVDLPQCGA